MARPLRLQSAGLTYHVMSRGNAKMNIYADDEDRQTFLSILKLVVDRHALRLFTYCEMTTHYHLACQTTEANISRAIRDLNGGYAQYFNRRHRRVGHVFQARFKAQVVEESAYLRTLCRYVAMNPVRGGIVARPELWPWSAHRALAGLDPLPPFLCADFVQDEFGGQDMAAARVLYVEYVNASRTGEDAAELVIFRKTTPVIGSADFLARFNGALTTAPPEVPSRERFLARPSLEQLLSGVPSRAELNGRILNAHDRYRYTLEAIAAFIGLTRSTVFDRLKHARLSQLTSRRESTQADRDRRVAAPERRRRASARGHRAAAGDVL